MPDTAPDTAPNTCRGSRTMAATAEIVFNTATDPSRFAAWLPLRIAGSGAGTAEVAWPEDGEPHRYEVTVRTEELLVEWRPTGSRGWPGRLRVVEAGAGASEVLVEVDGRESAEDVRRALDEALRGLAAEVDQNFTVG